MGDPRIVQGSAYGLTAIVVVVIVRPMTSILFKASVHSPCPGSRLDTGMTCWPASVNHARFWRLPFCCCGRRFSCVVRFIDCSLPRQWARSARSGGPEACRPHLPADSDPS